VPEGPGDGSPSRKKKVTYEEDAEIGAKRRGEAKWDLSALFSRPQKPLLRATGVGLIRGGGSRRNDHA